MNPPLAISYKLVGTGWSECEVVSGNARVMLSASYLSDALGKLVQSALSIATGFHMIEFGFDEEPGEYRWSIEAVAAERVQLRIVEFEHLWSNRPTVEGKPMLEATMRPIEYARAVEAAARHVLEEHGANGYAGKWSQHPFPVQALSLLQVAIAALPHDA